MQRSCLSWRVKPFPLVHCSGASLFGEESQSIMIRSNHASTLLIRGLGAKCSGRGLLRVTVGLILFTLLPLALLLNNYEGG